MRNKILDKLDQNIQKQITEVDQLKHSLKIQEIWPEAFNSGKSVSTRWIGTPSKWIRTMRPFSDHYNWCFEITANEETRRFDANKIAPAILPPTKLPR